MSQVKGVGELRQRQPRRKNKAYLASIRELPCVICGDATRTEACHLRAGSVMYHKRQTGLGEKPHDRPWTIPMCGTCHRSQHRQDELMWWFAHGIDPFRLCEKLSEAAGFSTRIRVIMETRIDAIKALKGRQHQKP